MPARGRHWQGAEALGLSVRGAPRDTRAQRGHPVQTTFQALTTLAIPHNWSTLPRRRHPTHPRQCTVLKVITGHHPPSCTSSYQFIWHVTPRTPPASPTPTQEGSSSTMHPGQSTEGEPVICAPKSHKKPKCPKKKVAAKKKKKCVKFKLSDNHCDSKYTISGSDNMIRCSLCMSWFHVECTGEDTQYQGIWCCNSCRTVPQNVQGITEKTTVWSPLSSPCRTQKRHLRLRSNF